LICAPLDRLDDDIVRARAAMAAASRAVVLSKMSKRYNDRIVLSTRLSIHFRPKPPS
jgi:hypothetical protein